MRRRIWGGVVRWFSDGREGVGCGGMRGLCRGTLEMGEGQNAEACVYLYEDGSVLRLVAGFSRYPFNLRVYFYDMISKSVSSSTTR